ncbi:hypothetical protein TNCV_1985151 [Trichonephila clavipes]|nr:hypothetical protein TNCV_1985151 [Trichonephila clavipes]
MRFPREKKNDAITIFFEDLMDNRMISDGVTLSECGKLGGHTDCSCNVQTQQCKGCFEEIDEMKALEGQDAQMQYQRIARHA